MIKVIINDSEYCLNWNISFADHKKIVEALNDDNTDFRLLFAELVHKKLNTIETPDVSVNYLAEKCNLLSVIDCVLNSDIALKTFYTQQTPEKDCYKTFFMAVHQKLNDDWNKIAKKIPRIETKFTTIFSAYENAFSKAITSTAMENIGKVLVRFNESIGELATKVTKLISEIKIPTISEERKHTLVAAFRIWGEYGWTILPHAPIFYYEEVPEDIKNANKAAMIYCRKDSIEKLFANLLDTKGIKKSDLEEAIFDYQHGKYKSCALILFSLIDAKLIRLQNPTKKRKVGKGAVDLLMKKIEDEKDIQQRFLLLLYYENLIACLLKMFEKGNDFRKQPDVINRNFIDHGMMTRKVLKRDCIQLFLLYYNLLIFLDFSS